MKNTLFICLFALCAFSGCVDDEEDFATDGGNISPELTPENKENAELNAAVFDQLNLDYPGLEKVKQHYEAGENYLAASALLEYYRMRANVFNPNLSLVDVTASDAEKSKADYALEYRFYVNGQLEDDATGKPYSVGKKGEINWANNPSGTSGEYQKQLHRHQWFIPQAKTYRDTRYKDEKYIQSWIEVYGDWIAKHPEPAEEEIGEGPWWQLQVSSRLTDQVQLLEYYKISDNFTPEWLTIFLASFAEQADFLVKYPYKNGGNILISQANALATAGILMPEFKNSNNWKQAGYKILDAEIAQFMNDGWHQEFSLHYHLGTVDSFYEIIKLANANNEATNYTEPLRKATEVLMHFVYPNYFLQGSSKDTEDKLDQIVPMFNDSWNKTRSIIQKNFKKYAEMFPESKELASMAAAGNSNTAPEFHPGNEIKVFEDAGFYIMRNGWTPESTVMIFSNNHDKENAFLEPRSHNQGDNGTFELYINNRNFFPDSGVCSYDGTSTREQRKKFRKTTMHNTLTLGDNNYTDATEAKLLLTKDNGNYETLVFQNKGYSNMTHRRAVFYVNKEFFVIVDEGIGEAVGNVQLNFNPCRYKEEIVFDKNVMGAHSTFNDNNIVIRTFPTEGSTFVEKEGVVAYVVKDNVFDERNAYYIQREKNANEAVRFITVIYPCSSTDGQTIEAEFTDNGYDVNGASVKVTINNGMSYNLSYSL